MTGSNGPGTDEHLPYNHLGSIASCAPLPFRPIEEIQEPVLSSGGWQTLYAQVPIPGKAPLVVRLDTDSGHVANFFQLNWGERRSSADYAVRLIVRRSSAATYSLGSEYDSAILVSRDARVAAVTGSEYYTKVKTTLRMLCSTFCGTNQLYLHGCSVELNGHGLLICGFSGVGKTTLVNAIRDRAKTSLRMVNEDWSPLSLADYTTCYTGEDHLHMKYPAVAAIAPDLKLGPDHYPSEFFFGDVSDRQARLMISREELFGAEAVCDAVKVDGIWLLDREDPQAPLSRRLAPSDAPLLESTGHGSASPIPFEYLNGAFLFPDSRNLDQQRAAHRSLLGSGKVRVINICGRPEAVAARLIARISGARTNGL